MTFKSADDHDVVDVPQSHFWCVDERYTYCDQRVTPDLFLSPDPTCAKCRARIVEHARYLAQLEAPDEDGAA